jgi:hypothetical protein
MATATETQKIFRVAAVSSNANSFGLHQFILIAEDGTAWKACGNYLKVRDLPKGAEVTAIMLHNGNPYFEGFELQETMPEAIDGQGRTISPVGRAPADVVKQVWSK